MAWELVLCRTSWGNVRVDMCNFGFCGIECFSKFGDGFILGNRISVTFLWIVLKRSVEK